MKAHYETQIESILILARSGIILFMLVCGMWVQVYIYIYMQMHTHFHTLPILEEFVGMKIYISRFPPPPFTTVKHDLHYITLV